MMIQKIIVMLLVFKIVSTVAEVGVGQPSSAPSSSARPRLKPSTPTKRSVLSEPKCFEESAEIINTKSPEAVIKKLFQNLNDDEVMARLILAESLASGRECSRGSQKEGITEGIAWVIANRMNEASGVYGRGREAIFKNQQFRSSFGGCDVAKRKALLCPSSLGEEWQETWNLTLQSVEKTKHTKQNPLKGVHHYFFGQHFNESSNCGKWKGVKPSWASSSARRHPDIKGLKADSDCLEFYEVR